MTAVGFVGLGQMGFRMATNLLKKMQPKQFVVFDVVQESARRFADQNKTANVDLSVSSSVRELAENTDYVITMLPNNRHVLEVYEQVTMASKPSLLIDSSTISPSAAKYVASQAADAGKVFVDAPVSGGILGAEAGTLTFMVGSKGEEEFAKAKELLQFMGKNIVRCGENGHGQVAKIVNNMLLGISMIASAEALNLGIKLGMDPKLLSNIINSSSGRCWSTDTYNPVPGVMQGVPAAKNYKGGFGNALMTKDLGLAVNASQEINSPVAMGSLAHQMYQKLSSTPGYEDKDFSSIFKYLNSR